MKPRSVDPASGRTNGIALVLLAAGQGRRFGGDKLSAPLDGLPLIYHAVSLFSRFSFDCKVAVVANHQLKLDRFDFEMVKVPRGHPALSRSIAAGVASVCDRAPRGIMLALADMPRIPERHVAALIDRFNGDTIASTDGKIITPPAILGPDHYAALCRLNGDGGAKSLLAGGALLKGDPAIFVDIDTTEDLERNRRT